MTIEKVKPKYTNFLDYMTKEKDYFTKQLAAALPKHINPDRMFRIFFTQLRGNNKLLECTTESIFASIIKCAEVGLEPGVLGHAYLVPYKRSAKQKDEKGRDNWIKIPECQFMIGYKGMLELARRSGQISSISAHAVYDNDEFDYAFGLEEKCVHRPVSGDRGAFRGAYAVVRLKDGGFSWGYMEKSEIDKIRDRSKTKDDGPWKTDYEEMAKKTVIRRIFKYLPVSVEIQKAAIIDEVSEIDSPVIDYSDINQSAGLSIPENKADVVADILTSSDEDDFFDDEVTLPEKKPEKKENANARI